YLRKDMETLKNHSISSAIWGIYRLLIIFFTLFSISYAQTIVIPLTIAALLTFLLTPLVIKCERCLGRVLSILFIVILAFSIIGFIGYIFARQLVLFGSDFPKYYQILQAKFQAIELPHSRILDWLGHIFVHLKDALLGNSQFEVKLV